MKTIILTTPNADVKTYVNAEKITYATRIKDHSFSKGDFFSYTEIGVGSHKIMVLETPEEIIEKIKDLKLNREWIV